VSGCGVKTNFILAFSKNLRNNCMHVSEKRLQKRQIVCKILHHNVRVISAMLFFAKEFTILAKTNQHSYGSNLPTVFTEIKWTVASDLISLKVV
jgi:hypothetical protein